MFVGIDTSNYTTSIAVVDQEKVISCRQLLRVPLGKTGMRQSECVFSHMEVLADEMESLAKQVDFSNMQAIGVSTQPRRTDQSYMPVFMAGYHLARSLSAAFSCPLYRYSHQEGHLMAALFTGPSFWQGGEPFLFLHLSGGTTEWLLCRYENAHFDSEIVASTEDISAGQLIDRVGVKMGLPFPSGSYLESLAKGGSYDYELPVHVKDRFVNFSGCEAEVNRIMERENYPCQDLAYSVLHAISKTLVKQFELLLDRYPQVKHVVAAGGVVSCEQIRKELSKGLCHRPIDIQFAPKEYSSDNAVGIAALAQKEYEVHGK